MNIIKKTTPITPGVIMLLFLGIISPVFSWYQENRSFGPSSSIVRSYQNGEFSSPVLLTFDDGPSIEWTSKIAGTLKENNIKGVFFIVGKSASKHPQIIKELLQSGMEIGVHSYSHKSLPYLSTKEIEEEIDKTIESIRSASGVTPIYFRPPYGFYNKEVIEIARSRNLTTILWTKNAKDWKKNISPAEIIDNVTKALKPGDIILFHDGPDENADRKATLNTLPVIIRNINRQLTNF
jgi:peptidoglycan/xylan/chitin deacetylase (PgdA/CDA1 family)